MPDAKGDSASPSTMSTTGTIPVEVLNAPDAARFGKYVCTRRLGGGGDGDVWKAWDGELSRWVALKFLKGGDAEEVARFDREARTAAQLSHPGIATVFDVGQMNGRFYLTMLYVDGRTLHQFPRQDRKLLVSFVRDTARALAFAHQRGVVHRDIKPQNILVAGRSMADSTWVGGRTDYPHRVYLTDFGLAKSTQGLPEAPTPGTIMGTPVYMSPEQSRGQPLDATTDVYSLGITLYELLGDRVPFKGADVLDTLKKVQSEEPAPLRSLNSWVDRDLETIVHKSIEKSRGRRYPDAAAFADDLDRWLRKEPILARPANPFYRLSKMFARRRAMVLVVVGALLLVALAWTFRPDFDGKGSSPALSMSESQRAMVREMRSTAEVCIDAALDLRRAGTPASASKYADRLNAACTPVIEAVPALAEPHWLMGRMLRAQQRPKEALAEQGRALAKEADFAPAVYERAVLATRLHRAWLLEAMPRVFRQSGEAAGPSKVGARDLASEFITRMRSLQQNDAAGRNLTPDLAKDLGFLEQRLPTLPPGQAACVKGLRAWSRGDPSEAFRQHEAALRLQPSLQEACEELAALCCVAMRFDEAERWYSQGIDQDRGYLPFHLGRGRVRLLQALMSTSSPSKAASLLEGAAADLATVIAAFPQLPEPWCLRGQVRGLRGMIQQSRGEDPTTAWTGAIADLDEALKRDAKSGEALRFRAQAHLDLADRAGARPEDSTPHLDACIRDCTALIKEDAIAAQAWELRGRARTQLAERQASEGVFASAVEDLKKFTELASSSDIAWTRLGGTYIRWAALDLREGRDPRARAEDAVPHLDRAIELNPGRAEAWLFRSRAHQLRSLSPGLDRDEVQAALKLASDDFKVAEKTDFARSSGLAPLVEELRRALRGSDY